LRDYFKNGNAIPSIAPPTFAFKLVRKILEEYSKYIITITIRNAKHLASKNSNIKIWEGIAKFYEEKGFKVIIIPDIESISHENNLDKLSYMCASNQAIRSAVYDAAFINLGVNNGAIAPMMFNANSRFLLTKTYTEGTNTNKQFFKDVTGITSRSGLWTKVPWHQLIFSSEENPDEIICRADDLFDKATQISNIVSEISNNSVFLDPWAKLDGTILINNNFNINDYTDSNSPVEKLLLNFVKDSSFFGSVKSLIVRSLSCFLKNNYTDALILAKQAILLDGRYVDPYLVCCLIYKNEGNELLANQYMKSSWKLSPIFFTLSNDQWYLNVNDNIKDILMQ
jgi:hypothetical protein